MFAFRVSRFPPRVRLLCGVPSCAKLPYVPARRSVRDGDRNRSTWGNFFCGFSVKGPKFLSAGVPNSEWTSVAPFANRRASSRANAFLPGVSSTTSRSECKEDLAAGARLVDGVVITSSSKSGPPRFFVFVLVLDARRFGRTAMGVEPKPRIGDATDEKPSTRSGACAFALAAPVGVFVVTGRVPCRRTRHGVPTTASWKFSSSQSLASSSKTSASIRSSLRSSIRSCSSSIARNCDELDIFCWPAETPHPDRSGCALECGMR